MQSRYFTSSKIKVTDQTSLYYRWRGTVREVLGLDTESGPISYLCHVHDDTNHEADVTFAESQIDTIQKKFIDIEQLRENDVDLGNGVMRLSNAHAFEVGDTIQITEKIDGANASIAWNKDLDKLEAFSRTNLLSGADGLRGFKSFIDIKNMDEKFRRMMSTIYNECVIFGEWLVSHHCKYNADRYNHWYVYDVWLKANQAYAPQELVKQICEALGLEYVHVLYEGPFVSWDHCRSFMHKNTYGEQQEGVVVKNQTKLNRDDIRAPKVLKIVNKEFLETIAVKPKKEIDPEQKKLEDEAKVLMSSIVTEARVRKLILKAVDAGVVPDQLEPKHIGTLMKRIPKEVYEDLIKEEPEIMKKVGEYAGKFCGSMVADHIKAFILGK